MRGLVSIGCEMATIASNPITAMREAVTANRGSVTVAREFVTAIREAVTTVHSLVTTAREFVTVVREVVTPVRAAVRGIRSFVMVVREVGRCLIVSNLHGFCSGRPNWPGFCQPRCASAFGNAAASGNRASVAESMQKAFDNF